MPRRNKRSQMHNPGDSFALATMDIMIGDACPCGPSRDTTEARVSTTSTSTLGEGARAPRLQYWYSSPALAVLSPVVLGRQ